MARGSIVKRKSGNYSIVYYVHGKQKWKNIGPVRKEAEKALREIMGQVDAGTYREMRSISFSKFCDKWLEHKRATEIKPTTYDFYSDIVRLHLKAYFKDRPIHHIRTEDIDNYIAFKKREKKLSPNTVGYHVTVLRMIFKQAVIWERINRNPAKHVKKPKRRKYEMQMLKPEEVQKLLEHVDIDYYPFFLAAVLTGLRLGELLALRWSDINWFSQQINVRRAVSEGIIQSPKSEKSVRRVDMAPALLEALREHKNKQKVESLFSDDNLVFPNENGGLLDRHNVYSRHFAPALKKAGLPLIRFHDLRHCYISFLIASGENLKYVQSQAGHASITTTLDRYGHLIPDAHNGASERLQKTIFSDKDRGYPETESEESAKISLMQ